MADKKDKTVMVEMTEEQKNEFVNFKASQKPKEAAVPEPLESIFLKFEHTRNGIKHGPGQTTEIPAGLASSLLAADQEALKARLREHESHEGIAEILGYGQSRRVKGALR